MSRPQQRKAASAGGSFIAAHDYLTIVGVASAVVAGSHWAIMNYPACLQRCLAKSAFLTFPWTGHLALVSHCTRGNLF